MICTHCGLEIVQRPLPTPELAAHLVWVHRVTGSVKCVQMFATPQGA